MRAMVLPETARAESAPLRFERLPDPEPAAGEILIEVRACGVCRTDLHVVEGDLRAPSYPIVPGHQVVGRVLEVGSSATDLRQGDRVGVAWVHRFCGCCRYCIAGQENLCLDPVFTGFHRHGGYASRIVAPAPFVYPIPDAMGDDLEIAPLLCAGIIGYRAILQSGLRPGRRISMYGFGSSAHIALQIAKAWGCEVFVVTRSEESIRRARSFGADWAGTTGDTLPAAVEHSIFFAPVGSALPHALEGLARGGTCAVAGIYLDRIPELDYERHLFQEKRLVSVTANTRADGRELLDMAARIGLRTDIEVYPLAGANDALEGLKRKRLGAQCAVLRIAGDDRGAR